jgi:hypothetical protein
MEKVGDRKMVEVGDGKDVGSEGDYKDESKMEGAERDGKDGESEGDDKDGGKMDEM